MIALGTLLLAQVAVAGPRTGVAPPRATESPPHVTSAESDAARVGSSMGAPPRSAPQRLLLAAVGAVEGAAAYTLVRATGDRLGVADPGAALGGAAFIALAGVASGGLVELAGGGRGALPESIEPATASVGVVAHGTAVRDEADPYAATLDLAPTLLFPSERGHLRLLANLTSGLGARVERDPRPQVGGDGGPATALEARSWATTTGLEVAMRVGRRSAATSSSTWELRYRPEVAVANERLSFADGTARDSRRVAATPFTFGARLHVTPRQRYTVYLGPRWDFLAYGAPGALRGGRPLVAPAYGEAWYALDLPFPAPGTARAVSQVAFGYVHSRFASSGFNIGKTVGFLGTFVTQYSVRLRPRGAKTAVQLDVGAELGGSVLPFARAGVVLPGIRG